MKLSQKVLTKQIFGMLFKADIYVSKMMSDKINHSEIQTPIIYILKVESQKGYHKICSIPQPSSNKSSQKIKVIQSKTQDCGIA